MKTFEQNEALKALYEYIFTGAYGERTHVKQMKEQAKDRLQSLLADSDEKRYHFDVAGEKYIAKFVPKEIKKTNHSGLISDIMDYVRSEALSKIISFDMAKLKEDELLESVESFKLPDTHYIRFTPNKLGKSYKNEINIDMNTDDQQQLVKMIAFHSERAKMIEPYHQRVMAMFENMPISSIKSDVGTISKIAHAPKYNVLDLINTFGDDFAIQYGKVDLEALKDWFAVGVLPRSVLSANQETIDIRLDFMVLSEAAEIRMLDAYHNIQNYRKSKTIADVI